MIEADLHNQFKERYKILPRSRCFGLAPQGSPAVVRHFESACMPYKQADLQALKQIAGMQGVAAVVGLPDLHHKPHLETPSSMVVATRGQVVLGFTSPSPNCGMALACLGLARMEAGPQALDALFQGLIQRLPEGSQQPVLDDEDLLEIMVEGAPAAVRRLGLDPAITGFMDQAGNAFGAVSLEARRRAVLDSVPPVLWREARRRFGQVGKGNHFLEIQALERIYEPEIAAAWGLERNELVAMYHADSGYLGALAGRLYAHRRKNTWHGRLHELQIKVPFQARVGNLAQLFARFYKHVLPRSFSPLHEDSEEAQRALNALRAAGNYAFANRLYVLAALRDALKDVWGASAAEPALLWDAPHNSITQEQVDSESVWVHRHNAARVLPSSALPVGSPFAATGHPVLLPGTEQTASYLAVTGPGSAASLYSADHGAGKAAAQLGLRLPEALETRIYTYQGGFIGSRPQLSDAGVDEVMQVLEENEIARPVARLRPVAVLKGSA